MDLALDLLERTQLRWSRKAGQFISDVAPNANGTCEQRIEVADRDVLGEVFDTGDGRADGFDGVWVVVYGQNEEGCELRERRVYPLRLDVGAVTHCCAVCWCTGRKWTAWNTMRMIISMTLLI